MVLDGVTVTTTVHQRNQSLTAYVERHIMLETGIMSILVETQLVIESGSDEIHESGTGKGTGDKDGEAVDPDIKVVTIDDLILKSSLPRFGSRIVY